MQVIFHWLFGLWGWIYSDIFCLLSSSFRFFLRDSGQIVGKCRFSLFGVCKKQCQISVDLLKKLFSVVSKNPVYLAERLRKCSLCPYRLNYYRYIACWWWNMCLRARIYLRNTCGITEIEIRFQKLFPARLSSKYLLTWRII